MWNLGYRLLRLYQSIEFNSCCLSKSSVTVVKEAQAKLSVPDNKFYLLNVFALFARDLENYVLLEWIIYELKTRKSSVPYYDLSSHLLPSYHSYLLLHEPTQTLLKQVIQKLKRREDFKTLMMTKYLLYSIFNQGIQKIKFLIIPREKRL